MPVCPLRMSAGMGVNTPIPSGKLLKHGQTKSNFVLVFTNSWNILRNHEIISKQRFVVI